MYQLLPLEGEHEGENNQLPPGGLRPQDQYLGEAEVNPEAEERFCIS